MPKTIDEIDIGDVDPVDLIAAAHERGVFVYDLETTGLEPRNDKIEGIAFYIPDDAPRNFPAMRAWYPFTKGTMRCHVKEDESPEEQFARLSYESAVNDGSAQEVIEDRKTAWKSYKRKTTVQELRPPMDQPSTMDALRPLFENSPGTVAVAANAKFDVAFLRHASGCERGFWMNPDVVTRLAALADEDLRNKIEAAEGLAHWGFPDSARLADSMLADFLCDENHFAYGLKKRTRDLFGHDMTTYKDVIKSRTQQVFGWLVDELKADALGHYAMEDCYWTWRIYKNRMEELDRLSPGRMLHEIEGEVDRRSISPFDPNRTMGTLERIFWGIDMKICLILEEMESRGVMIDWRQLKGVTSKLQKKKEEILSKIEQQIGWTLNPNSTPQVSALLFAEKPHGLGIPTKGIKQGKSGDYSTGSKEIAHLSRVNPIVKDILDWRSADTVIGNFSEKLTKLSLEDPHNRIYSHFGQTGTKIYRLNSSNPVNLQNQPRDPDLIRKAFCGYFEDDPNPELMLFGCDYCVVEGTRVSTTRGDVAIEDVVPNDDCAVLEDGSAAPITALIEKGTLPIVEIRTRMGYTLRATRMHRIRVIDIDGNYEWRRIGELRVTDHVAIQAGTTGDRRAPQLPAIKFTHHLNNREVIAPSELTEDLATFLGYIVGDGTIQHKYVGFVVAQKDEDVWRRMIGLSKELFSIESTSIEPYRGVFEARLYSRPIVQWCREIGVSKESVPDTLWSAPRGTVCGFLRGFFEADGSIGKKSNGQRVTTSGVSQDLMKQIHLLLLGVGVPAILKSSKQKLSAKRLWTVAIPSGFASVFSRSIGFVGARKQAQLAIYMERAGKSPSIGGFPNLQQKVRELRLSGSIRALLNNTSSLGRPVSIDVARQVREESQDVFDALELYRTVDYGTVFDSVDSIDSVGEARVYDLSVPGPTTYVSDGFLSHNSQIELRVAAFLSGDKGMIEVYSEGKPCTKGVIIGSSCERYRWWECNSKVVDGKDKKKCGHNWVPEQWDPALLTFREAGDEEHIFDSKGQQMVCPACSGIKIEHQSRCRHVDLHQRTADDANVPRNPLAKCLDGSTMILPHGEWPRTIESVLGEIEPGEHREIPQISLRNGRPGNDSVSAKSGLKRHNRPTKIVITRRGVVVATEDHRFQVIGDDLSTLHPRTPGYVHEPGFSLVEAQHLEKGMKLPLADCKGSATQYDEWHERRTPTEFRLNPFTKEPDPDGPASIILDEKWSYFAGLFAGDGCASGNACVITHGSDDSYADWRQVVRGACDDVGLPNRMSKNKKHTVIGSRVVRRYFAGMGLAKEAGVTGAKIMRVPPWVTEGGPKIIWSYIAGLFDADGTVGGNINFTTKYPEFAGQVALLLRWLGMPVSIQPAFNKTYERWYYTVQVLAEGLDRFLRYCPLRHQEKAEKLRERCTTIKRRVAPSYDEVLLVLDGGERTVYDFQVESDDHLYLQGGLIGHNNLNFGNLYRIGAPRFCQYADLYDEKGEPRLEYAQTVIDAWYDAYPAIRPFQDETEHKLKGENNWIAYTITGRPRRLGRERWKNEYRAVTQGIQFSISGSAQDILKVAMFRIFEAKNKKLVTSRPAEAKLWKRFNQIIQVHDEVMAEGPIQLKDEIIEMMTDSMENAADLTRTRYDGTTYNVPLKTDVCFGRTWDDIH